MDTGKVLFARIGWMKFYSGPQPNDERPVGGGSYNNKQLGHERFNFSEVEGKLYGYVEPVGDTINISRIDPKANKKHVDDVLVIFVADQFVVGWYAGARVYRSRCKPGRDLEKKRQGCVYNCEARSHDCVLLPTSARRCKLPTGKGGMGQSNVTYALEANNTPKTASWIQRARHWVSSYQGPNLLTDPTEEAEDAITAAVENDILVAGGQGHLASPETRRAIEQHAVRAATSYYEECGYKVEEVGKPYDLRCIKDKGTRYVEVKGTIGSATKVILTRNEVQFAKDHCKQMALFIVHSIDLKEAGGSGSCKPSGGTRLHIDPWEPEDNDLEPMSYTYRVPTSGG